MAELTGKLYPPYIEGTLPAFYAEDDGTAKIVVPFSMNRAVSKNDVSNLSIKIKTIQSNTFISTLYCRSPSTALDQLVAEFDLSKDVVDKMIIGQYFKIQLAFVGASGIGYYSTVGVAKFSAKPTVSIQDGVGSGNSVPNFRRTYVGIYKQEKDFTEKVYSYIFNLYDKNRQLIQTSGWLLHNSNLATTTSDYSVLNASIDTYTFHSNIEPFQVYYVEYGVRTINGIEVFSKQYQTVYIEGVKPNLKAKFVAENNFEEGYINLKLVPYSTMTSIGGTYVISRTSSDSNFTIWEEIKNAFFAETINFKKWHFKDCTVEQGKIYQYSLQQYNDVGLYSSPLKTDQIMADFEDMFLFDGEKQLKIRFNPRISSFKIDRLEQKIDTIGSKYPYFFKNGNVEYREFPISGIISYLEDNNEFFMSYDNLNLIKEDEKNRSLTPTIVTEDNFFNTPTSQLIGYNYAAERKFKMAVLEWLSNGQIKLFKSPAEGNYIIRLMNVSLAPLNDSLGRLVHTFSATAYQIADNDYAGLTSLGFINPEPESSMFYAYETQPFVKDGYFKHGKINTKTMAGYMFVENMIPGTFFYLGNDGQADSEKEKFVVGSNGSLTIDLGEKNLPNIYLPTEKNKDNNTFKYNFQGQVTYRYITKPVNRFNLVRSIELSSEVHTFIGPQSIIEYFDNNCKKEFYRFFYLNFQKKPIHILYTFSNDPTKTSYYKDELGSIPVVYFEDDCIYEVHNSVGQIIYFYQYQGGKIFIEDPPEYWVKIDGETLYGTPNVNLENYDFTDFVISNGIIVNCGFQVKNIDYEIEYTDQELIEYKNLFGVDDLRYLDMLERRLKYLELGEE